MNKFVEPVDLSEKLGNNRTLYEILTIYSQLFLIYLN